MDIKTLLRWLFNPWVVGGSIVVALVLAAAALSLLFFTRPGPRPAGPATAVLNVIHAPTQAPTLPPAAAASPTPEEAAPPAPAPGVLAIGAFVQITGTGGDGLRLRQDPSLQGEVRGLGAEHEVFQIDQGPQDADGFTWWRLVSPSEPARQGWAAANYLAVVQNPD